MDLALLQELKQKLLHEKRLASVWSFFLDHFGENADFMALGEGAHHPLVEAVVDQVGQSLFGPDGTARNLLLMRLTEQHFLHGGFSMGGRPGAVIYFEDAQIGLVTVADCPPSIEVKYARFSGRPIRPQEQPSRN